MFTSVSTKHSRPTMFENRFHLISIETRLLVDSCSQTEKKNLSNKHTTRSETNIRLQWRISKKIDVAQIIVGDLPLHNIVIPVYGDFLFVF